MKLFVRNSCFFYWAIIFEYSLSSFCNSSFSETQVPLHRQNPCLAKIQKYAAHFWKFCYITSFSNSLLYEQLNHKISKFFLNNYEIELLLLQMTSVSYLYPFTFTRFYIKDKTHLPRVLHRFHILEITSSSHIPCVFSSVHILFKSLEK